MKLTGSIDPARYVPSAIAMTLTLMSVGMLFMTLLLSYAILRFNSPLWPPMGMARPELFWPVVSSTLIALSSASYLAFEGRGQEAPRSPQFLHLALLLAVGFIISQGLFWQQLKGAGLYASAGIFPSLLYGLTWTHGGHVLLGTGLLGALSLGLGRFKDRETELLWIRNVGIFWHFLGVVWLILYLVVIVF